MFLYDNELESCYTAHLINLDIDRKKRFQEKHSVILYSINGSVLLKSGEYDDVPIEANHMVFIPSDFPCTLTAVDKYQGIMLCFPEIIPLCNKYLPEVAEEKEYTCEVLFHTLRAKRHIAMWFSSLQMFVSELQDQSLLIKTKTQELFVLLKLCYPKEGLTYFLSPVFSYNYDFSLFVLNNHYKVKTVQELAELSSLSLSGFEKEFRKVFGSSPYRWMLKKKTKKLYYEICTTKKLFKVIAEEYGFLSLSQLGDFCRKHFQMSPRELRNSKKKQ